MDLDFKERYKTMSTFLSFMGIISAVKQLRNEFKSDTLREGSIFFKVKKPTNVVYQKLVNEKRKLSLKTESKEMVHRLHV